MLIRNKVEAAYKAKLFTRYDDMGFIKYFSKEDFQGLQAQEYRFKSSHGHMLKGRFYSYDGYDEKRLIVFEHGLGGGHRSYMKEIERLCSLGYRVFSYDHTGCMESGGENMGGFSQFLCDLDDCLKALKADEEINTADISVVGHSGGGYSALNILALHSDVKRIVAISGYISIGKIVEQYFHGALSVFRKNIIELERASNPEYIKYNAVSTLKNSNAKVLLIYSDNDQIVKKEYNFDALKEALEGKDGIEFLLTSHKGHNPNYTVKATQYLAEMTEALAKSTPKTAEEKAQFKNSFDWDKMTEQDEAVWKKIKNFLN